MESMLGRPHTLASDSSAKYAYTNKHTGTYLCKRTHTHTSWLTQRKIQSDIQKQKDKDTHTFTQTLCEIASVSGKTLDGCLSGFYNGRFQGLLSVIIFSLEKSGLCCEWYNRPRNLREMLNVTRT